MHVLLLAFYIAFLGAYFYISLAIQFVLMEVCNMAFEIKPNRKESENKTIRFPLELIERINEAIAGKDVSFSNFVIQAVEYALDNMDK